jgi:hypothetical protein
MMRDIPIIYSGPMVRALLDGRKIMTRRLAWRDAKFGLQDYASEHLEDFDARGWKAVSESKGGEQPLFRVYKPTAWQRVKPGDRLWVRENVTRFDKGSCDQHIWFQAGRNEHYLDEVADPDGKWTLPEGPAGGAPYSVPSIHMPRWASRLTLIVTAVEIERLQDISEEDAWDEGVCCFAESLDRPGAWAGLSVEDRRALTLVNFGSAARAFNCLFDHLHKPGTWESNPEVIALSFAVHKENIEYMPTAVAA